VVDAALALFKKLPNALPMCACHTVEVQQSMLAMFAHKFKASEEAKDFAFMTFAFSVAAVSLKDPMGDTRIFRVYLR
jgi:hypothetical protein